MLLDMVFLAGPASSWPLGFGELLRVCKYNLNLRLHLGDTLDLVRFHPSHAAELATREPGLLPLPGGKA